MIPLVCPSSLRTDSSLQSSIAGLIASLIEIYDHAVFEIQLLPKRHDHEDATPEAQAFRCHGAITASHLFRGKDNSFEYSNRKPTDGTLHSATARFVERERGNEVPIGRGFWTVPLTVNARAPRAS